MRAYFRSVPKGMIEAAAIDGAGSFRTRGRSPAPGAPRRHSPSTVLVFMWSWNEFLLPLVMLTTMPCAPRPSGSRSSARTPPTGSGWPPPR